MMHPYPVLGQVIPNHALLPHLLCRFGRFGEPTFLFAIFLIFYRRTLYPVIQLWIPTPLLQTTHTHMHRHMHTHTHTHTHTHNHTHTHTHTHTPTQTHTHTPTHTHAHTPTHTQGCCQLIYDSCPLSSSPCQS